MTSLLVPKIAFCLDIKWYFNNVIAVGFDNYFYLPRLIVGTANCKYK